MSIKILASSVKTRSLSVLTAILMIPILATQSSAQLSPGFLVSVKFPGGKDLGAPARTSGAGSRGPACGNPNSDAKSIPASSNEIKTPLTALTPQNNVLTTAVPHPSVYVYIPQAVDKKAEFRVIDIETEQVVHKKTFSLVNTPGILKVNIPTTVKLKADNTYQWQVLVICNPKDREADKVVEGWIKHTPLTAEQTVKIQTAQSAIEQAKLYSEFGFWNETLMILDGLRSRNSQAQAEWEELLTSVKLNKLEKIPVSDCCKVSSTPSPLENDRRSQE
jgi:hypothetical protein